MSLSDELDRLWGEVGRLGRPITGYRNPGLEASQVRDRLGLDTPPEVLEWFAFSNGIEYADSQTQNDVALVPGYEPLSLDEAIAVRDENLDYEDVLGNWWIPLLASGGGDMYAAVGVSGESNSRVSSIMVGGESRRAFGSVEGMASFFVRMYRDGTFFVRSDGVLWADYDRWIALEKEQVDGP